MIDTSISVVLCTYNGMAYVQIQLDSILEQTQLPQELIIVDDHSIDGTFEFLQKYAHPNLSKLHLVLLQNEVRVGSVKSFEKALRLSNCHWVAFADQDDFWCIHKLETLLNNSDHADLIFSNALLVDEYGIPLGRSLWDDLDFDQLAQDKLRFKAVDLLKSNFVITGAAMMVNRKLALQCTPIAPGIHHDAWIAWELALRGCRFVSIPQSLWHYRIHSAQQVGVGLSNSFLAYWQRFFFRDENHLNKLLSAYAAMLQSKHLDLSSDAANFVQEKQLHLQHRLARSSIPSKTLWHDWRMGAYHRHSGGTKSFVKDLVVNFSPFGIR